MVWRLTSVLFALLIGFLASGASGAEQRLLIERNASGQITQLSLPSGHAFTFTYDGEVLKNPPDSAALLREVFAQRLRLPAYPELLKRLFTLERLAASRFGRHFMDQLRQNDLPQELATATIMHQTLLLHWSLMQELPTMETLLQQRTHTTDIDEAAAFLAHHPDVAELFIADMHSTYEGISHPPKPSDTTQAGQSYLIPLTKDSPHYATVTAALGLIEACAPQVTKSLKAHLELGNINLLNPERGLEAAAHFGVADIYTNTDGYFLFVHGEQIAITENVLLGRRSTKVGEFLVDAKIRRRYSGDPTFSLVDFPMNHAMTLATTLVHEWGHVLQGRLIRDAKHEANEWLAFSLFDLLKRIADEPEIAHDDLEATLIDGLEQLYIEPTLQASESSAEYFMLTTLAACL